MMHVMNNEMNSSCMYMRIGKYRYTPTKIKCLNWNTWFQLNKQWTFWNWLYARSKWLRPFIVINKNRCVYKQTFKVWLDGGNERKWKGKKQFSSPTLLKTKCLTTTKKTSIQKKVALKYVSISVAPTKLPNPIHLFCTWMVNETNHSMTQVIS